METRGKKTDRRSMRSKQAILEAMQALVLEKKLKQITVTDIVERANVGRTTFYSHFEDMPDLYRFIFSRFLLQIEQEIEASIAKDNLPPGSFQSLIPSQPLFKIAAEKHIIFKVNAETPEHGLRLLIEPLLQRFEKQLDDLGVMEAQGGLSRRMIATYLFNALIALLIDWVLTDMPESPEVMDKKFQILAEPTLKLLVG